MGDSSGDSSLFFISMQPFLVIMFRPQNKHTSHCVHTRQMRPIRDWVTGLWPISEDFSRKKKYSLSSFLSALSGMRCTWMKVGSVGRRGGEMFRRRMNLGRLKSCINGQHSLFITCWGILNIYKHQNFYISATHLELCLDCISWMNALRIIYRLNRTVTI